MRSQELSMSFSSTKPTVEIKATRTKVNSGETRGKKTVL